MSFLVEIATRLITKRYGRPIQMGEIDEPFFMGMNNDYVKGHRVVAASGTAELFDGSESDPFATASLIWIRSDRDCVVQLTYDTAGTYGKEVHTMAVKGSGEAGVMGPPLLVPDAQAYANYTEDFAAGTLVYCDRVTIENTDSSNAANIEYFIAD